MPEILQPRPATPRRTHSQAFSLRRYGSALIITALVIAGFGSVASARPAQEQDPQASDSPAATQPAPMTPPRVTYEDGQLTIVAENSLLADVLSAVHKVMGADVDLPAGASSERVWIKVGPGPARKVLGALLSGTDLDYVIQGSATDADGIRSVLLTMHGKGATSSPQPTIDPSERFANRRGPRPETVDAAEQPNPTPTPSAAASDMTPPPPSSPSLRPLSDEATLESTVDSSVAHPTPPSSMTQQQISQQLQSMYEQRRQMQQSQQTPPQNRQ